MSPEQELRELKYELNKDRMKGKIDFKNMIQETKNDNTYLRITCTNKKAANNIQSRYVEKMSSYTYINFDGIKNPSTENRYIYFVIHNYN